MWTMDYSKTSFNDLKQLLRDRHLETKGKKIDLIERLQDDDKRIEEESKKFKVYVKTLVGSFYTIFIEPSSTILELKNKIKEKNGCPPDKQKLYFLCRGVSQLGDIKYPDGTVGKATNDIDTLSALGVQNESFFSLQIRLI